MEKRKNKWGFDAFEGDEVLFDKYGVELLSLYEKLMDRVSEGKAEKREGFEKGVTNAVNDFIDSYQIDINRAIVKGFPIYLTTDEWDVYLFWFAVKIVFYEDAHECQFFLNVHKQYFDSSQEYAVILKNEVLSRLKAIGYFVNSKASEDLLWRYINSTLGVSFSSSEQKVEPKQQDKKETLEKTYENNRLILTLSFEQMKEYFSVLTKPYEARNKRTVTILKATELENWICYWFSYGQKPERVQVLETDVLTKADWRFVFDCLYERITNKITVLNLAHIMVDSISVFDDSKKGSETTNIVKHFKEIPSRLPKHIKLHCRPL